MKLKGATYRQVRAVDMALAHVKRARELLKEADCPMAVRRVRATLKVIEGAQRHIGRRFHTAVYGQPYVFDSTPGAGAKEEEKPQLPDLDLGEKAAAA
jgi:hypothetical protein